jgi:hypothetical protein
MEDEDETRIQQCKYVLVTLSMAMALIGIVCLVLAALVWGRRAIRRLGTIRRLRAIRRWVVLILVLRRMR